MSEPETIRVGKWDVSKNLYDDYVKFRTFADLYALKKADPSIIVPMSEYERQSRWLLCVQKVMQLHREICEIIKVPYSEEPNDEFYKAFKNQTEEDVRRKMKNE